MKRAIRLLIICAMTAALLAALAVCAAAEGEPTQTPEAEDSPAEVDPMAPVDTPAAAPSGAVYTVASAGAAHGTVTMVDYTAAGVDSGMYIHGGSGYYYGAQISGASCGAVIDGADSVYFGSSNGSLPLYDERGAASGIVWGGCRPTAVDCDEGIFLNGDVTGGVLVEDGASFDCRQAVLLCGAGSGSFRFCNARLHSDIGVLADLGANAGDVQLCYENGSYQGSFINDSDSTLSVTVGHGAMLFGDTKQLSGPIRVTVEAGAVWAVESGAQVERLAVEEGATVYAALTENEDGSLTLTASDAILEPGTYAAEPVTADLPIGHGPALPEADGSIGAASEPELDARRQRGLFPLAPVDQADTEAVEEPETEEEALPNDEIETLPEDETEAVPESEAAIEADAASEDTDEDFDRRLFPLTPAPEPAEEEEPVPEEDEASMVDDGQLSARRGLLTGVALACPRPSGAPAGTVGFAAQLALAGEGRPLAATALKAGIKTHSFLPEALDNRAVILYNPYCCSAA